MKSNIGRILTIVVEITDDKQSEWIWKNHMGDKCYGVNVFCIGEGDVYKTFEEFFNKNKDLE